MSRCACVVYPAASCPIHGIDSPGHKSVLGEAIEAGMERREKRASLWKALAKRLYREAHCPDCGSNVDRFVRPLRAELAAARKVVEALRAQQTYFDAKLDLPENEDMARMEQLERFARDALKEYDAITRKG